MNHVMLITRMVVPVAECAFDRRTVKPVGLAPAGCG